MTTEDVATTIAIDGPAASGKTTVGQLLADRLGYLFLDTGCMYRAVTLAALRKKIPIGNEEAVTQLAIDLKMEILPAGDQDDGRLYTVKLDGEDVTWDLRSSDVDRDVSQVSSYGDVRKNLVMRQRRIAAHGCVVVVGRDIGTVVLPDARLKLYIVASAEERARRRWEERKAQHKALSFDEILADIKRRDLFDGNREHSPMKPAEDAILIDTTGRTLEQILHEILAIDFFRHQDFGR